MAKGNSENRVDCGERASSDAEIPGEFNFAGVSLVASAHFSEVPERFFRYTLQLLLAFALGSLTYGTAVWASPTEPAPATHHTRSTHVQESSRARTHMARLRHSVRVTHHVTRHRARLVRTRRRVRRHRYYEHFTASSYTTADLEEGDVTGGEDPVVRQAAIDALGNMNGTVVAIDPSDGRILAMVNQKLALSSGAEPCSTIKISVALAALEEGIVTKDTEVHLGRHFSLNMTEAIAHSNNLYFETLGRKLGFERVHYYAKQFGLGELAGWNIPGEQLGTYPNQVLPASEGGVGRMCSFGQGVEMTPLQLGALVAAVANGGTLYYLQHPTTPEEVADFQPRVKRQLDIGKLIPEITSGMEGAVDYGTARLLRTNFKQLPILGKTGTCSDHGTRFGWFASYADTSYGRIVAVFFLEGGRPTFGPKAAELSGIFYRDLWDHSYFTKTPAENADALPAAVPPASPDAVPVAAGLVQ